MMRGVTIWLPLLLQAVVPAALIGWLWTTRRKSCAEFGAVALLATCYTVAIGMAGLWLVLPWFLPIGKAIVLAGVAAIGWRRLADTPGWPPSVGGRIRAGLAVVVAIGAMGVVVSAQAARRFPVEPFDVAFPLTEGMYLVVNGGSHVLVNAHVGTRDDERAAAYRGQSYGLDLVRIDRLGRRAAGVQPADPRDYGIFDEPILAPCGGRVVASGDGLEDLRPPAVDRDNFAGNYVIIDCGPAWIVLAHLRKASVLVHAGQTVVTGQRVGHVGNTGNTGEPHLHLHAQRPGSTDALFGGDPVPIRLGGRDLVRNDRVSVGR